MTVRSRLDIDARDRTAKVFASIDRKLTNMDRLARRLSGGLAAVGGGAVLAGIGSVAKKALDAGDQIEKLSRRSQASARFLSEMRHSLNQNGVTLAEFTTGLRNLNKNTANAVDGLKTQSRAFDKLGIDARKFINLDTDTKFAVLSDAIAGVANPSERSQIAMDLLGRAGEQLLTVMEDGSAGINRYRQEAEQLGLSLSQDQVEGAAAANDALDRLSSSISGSATQVLIRYTGEIERAADFTREYLPSAIEFLINIFRGLKVVVQGVVIAILSSFEKLLGLAGKIPGIGQKFKSVQLAVGELADVLTLQMDETIAAMSGFNRVTDENAKAAKTADAINRKYSASLADVAGSTGKAAKETKGLTKAVEQLNAAERVDKRLTEYRADVIATQQEVAELNALYEAGKTTLDEHLALLGNVYPEAVRRLDSEIEAVFGDADLWGFPEGAAKDAEKGWSDTVASVSDGWQTFLSDVLEDGGTQAAENLWDNIERKAYQVIANIAAKWLSSQIFGGSFDWGNVASQFLGGGNGGGLNIGSLISGGKTIAGYFGGGSASTGYTAANFIGAEGTALAGGQSGAVYGGNLSTGSGSLGGYGSAAAGALVAAGLLYTFDSIQGARTPAQIARQQANQLQGGVRRANNPDDVGDNNLYTLSGQNGGNREIGDTLTILQGFLDRAGGGREGFFSGAGVRGQGSIGELAASQGLQVIDHGAGIKVIAESQQQLNELMAVYDERVTRAKLSTDDWLGLMQSGAISAANTLDQNVLQVIGGTEKTAKAAIADMDALFDQYVAAGTHAHDAVYQALSEKMGLSLDQVRQFVERSGHDVDTWAAFFKSASGKALGSIEDFVKASGGQLDALSGGISDFATTFVDEIDGAVRTVNRSLSTIDTSLEGAVDVNPSGGSPFLGNFNQGGRFVVPGTGNTDKRFSIGLTPGEVVSVEPKESDSAIALERTDSDRGLKTQLAALSESLGALVSELEFQRANA